MIHSYILSTNGIYKGYTAYSSQFTSRARAVMIDDIVDENHHWKMHEGNDGTFIRY